MNEEKAPKRSFFDITQYSEKTRKIIFGVIVAVLLAIIGAAMFIISPKNDADVAASETPSPAATQVAVDDETDVREEAVTPKEDALLQPSQDEGLPKNEQEEAAAAQKKIIEQSLQREKEQTDNGIDHAHEPIEDSEELKAIASKGILESCTDNPKEIKEQKQARMKPYFHEDSTDYRSPQSIFFLKECSVEAVTEPAKEDTEDIIVYVGVAWGAQFEENGAADTGYTQYRVIVDKSGIVSFDD